MLKMSALEHYRASEKYGDIALYATGTREYDRAMQRAIWHAQMVLATSIVVVGTPEELNAIVKD